MVVPIKQAFVDRDSTTWKIQSKILTFRVNAPKVPLLETAKVVASLSTKAYTYTKYLQSNWMFSCEQHCNIVPKYCSYDRQIALSDLQATQTNCKLKFTKDL
jgi:hypothetical protein